METAKRGEDCRSRSPPLKLSFRRVARPGCDPRHAPFFSSSPASSSARGRTRPPPGDGVPGNSSVETHVIRRAWRGYRSVLLPAGKSAMSGISNLRQSWTYVIPQTGNNTMRRDTEGKSSISKMPIDRYSNRSAPSCCHMYLSRVVVRIRTMPLLRRLRKKSLWHGMAQPPNLIFLGWPAQISLALLPRTLEWNQPYLPPGVTLASS